MAVWPTMASIASSSRPNSSDGVGPTPPVAGRNSRVAITLCPCGGGGQGELAVRAAAAASGKRQQAATAASGGSGQRSRAQAHLPARRESTASREGGTCSSRDSSARSVVRRKVRAAAESGPPLAARAAGGVAGGAAGGAAGGVAPVGGHAGDLLSGWPCRPTGPQSIRAAHPQAKARAGWRAAAVVVAILGHQPGLAAAVMAGGEASWAGQGSGRPRATRHCSPSRHAARCPRRRRRHRPPGAPAARRRRPGRRQRPARRAAGWKAFCSGRRGRCV